MTFFGRSPFAQHPTCQPRTGKFVKEQQSQQTVPKRVLATVPVTLFRTRGTSWRGRTERASTLPSTGTLKIKESPSPRGFPSREPSLFLLCHDVILYVYLTQHNQGHYSDEACIYNIRFVAAVPFYSRLFFSCFRILQASSLPFSGVPP